MPKEKKTSGRNKRGFTASDPNMQHEIASIGTGSAYARGTTNPLPSRDASQSSSKVGVKKNAPDAASPGVNLSKASKHSHRRSP